MLTMNLWATGASEPFQLLASLYIVVEGALPDDRVMPRRVSVMRRFDRVRIWENDISKFDLLPVLKKPESNLWIFGTAMRKQPAKHGLFHINHLLVLTQMKSDKVIEVKWKNADSCFCSSILGSINSTLPYSVKEIFNSPSIRAPDDTILLSCPSILGPFSSIDTNSESFSPTEKQW